MGIADSILCGIGGFLLLAVICCITTWEFTLVVMFFWLCYKIDVVYQNQKIITTNQSNLEKLIKKEL